MAHDRSLAKNSGVNLLGYSTFAKVLKHLGIVTSHSSVFTGESSNPKYLKKQRKEFHETINSIVYLMPSVRRSSNNLKFFYPELFKEEGLLISQNLKVPRQQ